MRSYFHFILTIGYTTLSIIMVFLVMQVFSCYPAPFSDSFIFWGILLWNLFCLSSFLFLTDLRLFLLKARKPIREEEQRLRNCLSVLQEKTDYRKNYRLRIIEEPGMNASVTGSDTIIVIKSMVQVLPEAELTALLAPQLGRLQSGAGIAAIAFSCASMPSRGIVRMIKTGLGGFRFVIRKGVTLGLIGVSFVSFLLVHFHLFHYMTACILYTLLINLTDRLFNLLWQFNCRHTDYRQDAFAHRLGYGPALKEALKKSSGKGPGIYDRIRRLEGLEENTKEIGVIGREVRGEKQMKWEKKSIGNVM